MPQRLLDVSTVPFFFFTKFVLRVTSSVGCFQHSTKSHCATEIDYALFVFQGRRGKGAIYTFATGNGGLIGDSCAYNGYVNSIFTIAISGVNPDDSRPFYAEDCAGIMASAYTYSRDLFNGVGKVVSEVVKSLGYGLLFAFLPENRSLAIRASF